jgi:hypothetical protein
MTAFRTLLRMINTGWAKSRYTVYYIPTFGPPCISEKRCGENQNTHFIFNNFVLDNHVIYEMMWKKVVRAGQATADVIRHMRFACWITKATDTRSEYVMHISFPRQQWLREPASMIRYTYTAWLLTYVYT